MAWASAGTPLAAAIVQAAAERGIALAEARDFDAPAGKGVRDDPHYRVFADDGGKGRGPHNHYAAAQFKVRNRPSRQAGLVTR
jgi:hypothetical protein